MTGKSKAASRVRAILTSPDGMASPNLARHLALETALPIAAAADLLREARLDRATSIATGFSSGMALAMTLGSTRRGRTF